MVDIRPDITFESLFDEHAPAIDKSLFKEKIIQDVMTSGKPAEIDTSGSEGFDITIKILDPHTSMGYNVFNSNADYNDWLRQSMHEPTEDEVMQSLRENG